MARDPGPATAEPMTASQRRLLMACAIYWLARRFAPSLRELVELAHLSSTSVAAYNLRRLERGHLITFERAVPRSICLTDAGWSECDLEPPLAMSPGPTTRARSPRQSPPSVPWPVRASQA